MGEVGNLAQMQAFMAMFSRAVAVSVKPDDYFDGSESVDTFFEALEDHFVLYTIGDEHKLAIAKNPRAGKVNEWSKNLGKIEITAYEEFQIKVKAVFPEVRDRVKIEAELYSVMQRRQENSVDFILRKIKQLQLLNKQVSEEQVIRLVVDRVAPEFQDRVEVVAPTTVHKLYQAGSKFDTRHPPRQFPQNVVRKFIPQPFKPRYQPRGRYHAREPAKSAQNSVEVGRKYPTHAHQNRSCIEPVVQIRVFQSQAIRLDLASARKTHKIKV